jgi:hypothetical protein
MSGHHQQLEPGRPAQHVNLPVTTCLVPQVPPQRRKWSDRLTGRPRTAIYLRCGRAVCALESVLAADGGHACAEAINGVCVFAFVVELCGDT